MLTEISQAAYILLLLIFVPVPFQTDRKIEKTPWITYGLLIANTVIFLVFILPNLGTVHENDVFDAWGVVPRSPSLLALVTYMFLHVSIAHLLWNSAFLWLFGPSGEDALGHFPYVILYLSGGIVAGLLHSAIVLLFAANSAVAYAPMVGASGAISAIIGLYAIRFYRSKVRMVWGCAYLLQLRTARFELPAIAGLSLWLIQNLYGAIAALFQPDRDGIAYWAHIGGFVFGMTVAEIAGMLGEGMREYLFADAVSAGERGEDGVREAVRNFQLLLQRRPDDDEVREALALLAQQAQSYDSPLVHKVVSEAYAMLLEQSLASGDAPRSKEWLAAFDQLGADAVIGSSALLRLAGKALKAGEFALAERLYLKVIDRFPDSRDGEQALLDVAALSLDIQESPTAATTLLKRFMKVNGNSSRTATNAPLSPWRRLTGRVPKV